MSKKDFVNGNDRLDRMLAEIPAVEVEVFDAEADEMDRIHAMSLAMVREAGKRTQAEIARELKVTQGAVSQMEKRDDMLLSTLRSYLTATGAENPRILVNGQRSRRRTHHLTRFRGGAEGVVDEAVGGVVGVESC